MASLCQNGPPRATVNWARHGVGFLTYSLAKDGGILQIKHPFPSLARIFRE
jgi:hypothetical protein